MGRIYRPVEVMVGRKKLNSVAIVDSAADESVISADFAKRLGARLYGELLARCASDFIVEGKYAKIKVKDLKNNLEADLEVGVSNIPFNTDDINDEGVDVLLGVDFLQETKMELKF